MKVTVTYYDIETDRSVVKDCLNFQFRPPDEGDFIFCPVDNSPKIYKSVSISHPILNMVYRESTIFIYVTGYQQVKNGGMSKTTTVIKINESL